MLWRATLHYPPVTPACIVRHDIKGRAQETVYRAMHDRKNPTTIRSRTEPRPFDVPVYVTRPILPPLEAYIEHLHEIWTSRRLTNAGPLTGQLEHLLRAYLEAPHVSLFNNGTMALMTACQALDLSGEVITTPFTFAATPHVLTWSRITPVFADIDPMTMTIDPAAVESLVTSRTTGILGVHVYGLPCAVGALQAIAEKFRSAPRLRRGPCPAQPGSTISRSRTSATSRC